MSNNRDIESNRINFYFNYFSEAIKSNPNDFSNYSCRGDLYCMVGNFQAAIKDYNKALELNPSSTDTRCNLTSTIQEANKNITLNLNLTIEKTGHIKSATQDTDTQYFRGAPPTVSKIGMFQPINKEAPFKQEPDPKNRYRNNKVLNMVCSSKIDPTLFQL